MCFTYPYPVGHFSTECMDDGIGCDGTCEEGLECECKCHSLMGWVPNFETNDDVAKWHKE